MGRCPSCGAWGSMSEEAAVPPRSTGGRGGPSATALPLAEVAEDDATRDPTGIGELDRVLGGGIVRGSVVLLGGEPGVGKSTLLLLAAGAFAATGRTVLYVSAEESSAQVRLRADRLGMLETGVLVAAERRVPPILELVEQHRPGLLVVDSIQTVLDPDHGSVAGSVAQVRDCAGAFADLAKRTGVAVVLVGHVTKEGAIAGPRVLEHLVDVVLTFDGHGDGGLRFLRATKNRFGAAEEVGCFEMTGTGLAEVLDPSRLFLVDDPLEAPGIVRTVTLEGPRPLAVEVQALAAPSDLSTPRRQPTGIDPARFALLVAVLERRGGISFRGLDLFVSAVGGVRLREPAADLAICLAITSSWCDHALPSGLAAVGEVGLVGEVRATPRVEPRLAEAARLGSTAAIVPASYDGPGHGLRLTRVRGLAEAVEAAFGPAPATPLRLVSGARGG